MPKPLDRRLTAARPDLADIRLKGRVEAERFVEGVARRVAVPVAPLRRRPAADAALETEALHGEDVTVFEDEGEGWAWVQLAGDFYVGYMPSEALAPPGPAPTHRVAALRTFVFPGPDIKLPPRAALCLGSRVAVRELGEKFALTAEGAIFAGHLVPLDAPGEGDFVAVAARFLGTPYLWGGRSALGIDCSGLVQTALAACGLEAPRDSDMQEAALGTPLALDAPLQRGDLLFWPGHVAMVEAPDTLLHANAHAMCVAREPLAPALARIAAGGSPLRGIRRMAGATLSARPETA